MDGGRKCFQLINQVLVERTLEEVVPIVDANLDGVRTVICLGLMRAAEHRAPTVTLCTGSPPLSASSRSVVQLTQVTKKIGDDLQTLAQEIREYQAKHNIRMVDKNAPGAGRPAGGSPAAAGGNAQGVLA